MSPDSISPALIWCSVDIWWKECYFLGSQPVFICPLISPLLAVCVTSSNLLYVYRAWPSPHLHMRMARIFGFLLWTFQYLFSSLLWRSVFCINNYNNPTFHGVVSALVKVNEVSYRMLRLFVHPALLGALMCSPDKCWVDGTEPSERHKQADRTASAQSWLLYLPVYTRHVPWPRVA